MRVHTGKALLAGVAAIALGLTACSSSGGGGGGTNSAGTKGTGAFSSCGTSPDDCNKGSVKPGGTLTYTIEKTVAGWNINYSPSNVFDIAEVEDGLMPMVFNAAPDLKPFLNTDLMDSATSSVQNGTQVITYKIKPDAVWSDGQPINFDDFQYQWQTSDPSICKKCGASSSAGYTSIAKMDSQDNGKTVVVTMKQPFADWRSMFGTLLPAHLAKEHGDDGTAAGLNASFQWFDKNVPTWSGGPFIITNYQKDTAITEKPNPKWYGATKSSLDQLIFRIITDQTQEQPALQNNEVDAIYPQPDTDLLRAVNGMANTQYYIGKGLIWEHYNLNEQNQFLKDKTLRQAIFKAVSRKDVIARTVGQIVPTIQPLGNHFYVPGQPGYQDNTTPAGFGNGDLAGAKKLLQNAGYKGVGSSLKTPSGTPVTLRCTYSAGNAFRQTECEYMQTTLKQLGIPVTLKTTQDLSELGTGNFDIIVFAWVGTPYVVAGAQQIYTKDGGAWVAYTHNNDPASDKLINQAVTQTNASKVATLLNKADKLLQQDAFELPLYQKPTMLATHTNLVNIRDNATSVGPPYNVQEWGVKSS